MKSQLEVNKEARKAEQVAKDKACVIAMQTGTKQEAQKAFNQLYKRYKDPIFFEVMRFVKLNKEVSDDLVQEVFVKVFEKIHTYDFSVVFSTWLYNVSKNHTIDYVRKNKYEVLSIETLRSDFGGDEESSISEISFQLEDRSADILNGVVREQRAKMVLDALNNGVKSEEAKQIVSLIFLEGLPYEKVAEQVNMPLGTIKALMFRAKGEMKEYIDKNVKEFEYGRICTTKIKAAIQEEELEEVED